MGIIKSKFDPKADDTPFVLESSNKVICRLEAKLGRDDWETLQGLFGLIYNKGMDAGSAQRADEIRKALGLGE